MKMIKIMAVLGIVAALLGCKEDKSVDFDPSKLIRPVKTYQVTAVEKVDMRTYPGRIQAGKKVDVSFIVNGPLIKLDVKEGDFIKKGTVIAKIDPASFKHNLNSIKAQLEEATSAYQRAKKLWASNAISKADYDRARSAYNVASSQKDLVGKSLKDTTIRAPFSGYIARRYVDNFQTVAAGTPIVSLQDIKDIEVVVNVPESLVMNSGNMMVLKAFAIFEVPVKQEYEMSIKEIGTEADPVTQTYPVKFVMPSPKNINVLPGMTVSVRTVIKEKSAQGAFAVPISAVFSDSSGDKYIWKLDGELRAHKHQVETDGLTDSAVYLTAGVAEGDEIVAAGTPNIVENMKVRRFQMAENIK